MSVESVSTSSVPSPPRSLNRFQCVELFPSLPGHYGLSPKRTKSIILSFRLLETTDTERVLY